MRYMVAVLLVVILGVVPAMAGENLNSKMFVTFADTSTVATYQEIEDGRRIDPVAYTAFDAYFGLLDYYCFTGISFKVENTPGMSSPAAYEPLLPGGLAIGGFETGVTVVSSECVVAEPVVVAVGHYFYLNLPGDIMIVDHPDFPRWVVDCNDQVDFYCLWQNGGVGMDPTPGDAECFGDVPVEASTWGVIKSLYR